ncbi:MAG: uracil-DNA glycosylase [Geminicoccaceae bacterium]
MPDQRTSPGPGPGPDCPDCPRLVAFRLAARTREPDWHNAPVPSFGDPKARLLIVGLAPGLGGANRTGRPFTGDGAGFTLYPALARFGWTRGTFDARVDDGLELIDCRITNAVRCVPPQNKPTGAEIATCRRFLQTEILAPPGPRAILALGRIAHDSTLRALGLRLAAYPFGHGAMHEIGPDLVLASSYHCSRYNMNTGRLTETMLDHVLLALRRHLDAR